MTIIQTLTLNEALTERCDLESRLQDRYGTADRRTLRDLSVSGEMPLVDAASVDELIGLDFLIHDR